VKGSNGITTNESVMFILLLYPLTGARVMKVSILSMVGTSLIADSDENDEGDGLTDDPPDVDGDGDLVVVDDGLGEMVYLLPFK
jgi:hypothetical protein